MHFFQGAIRKRVAPLSFCASMKCFTHHLVVLFVAIACIDPGVSVHAQQPRRLTISMGASGQQRLYRTGTAEWMIDGTLVYRRQADTSGVDTTSWSAFEQLDRCVDAHIAAASDTQVLVVARRITPTDSSWWTFSGSVDQAGRPLPWSVGVQLEAQGRFLTAVPAFPPQPQMLIFTPSLDGELLAMTLWSMTGDFISTLYAPTATGSAYTVAGVCGDSLVVIDPQPSRHRMDVFRGLGTTVQEWTTSLHPDVRWASITDNPFTVGGSRLVTMEVKGTILDMDGRTWPLNIPDELLRDLYIDGVRAACVRNGAVLACQDLRTNVFDTIRASATLYTGSDKIVACGQRSVIIARSGRELLSMTLGKVPPRQPLRASYRGVWSRGSSMLVSGNSVRLAGIPSVSTDGKGVIGSLAVDLRPGAGDVLDTSRSIGLAEQSSFIASVNGETWIGTTRGVFRAFDGALISNRPGYGAVGDGSRAFLRTDRGIERREVGDSVFHVYGSDPSILWFDTVGDVLVTMRVEDITTDLPESRWVVDAYDGNGTVLLYGTVVVDSAVTRGLRFRSLTATRQGLLINGSRCVFLSRDVGATWDSIAPNVHLHTPVINHEGDAIAWGEDDMGRSGPCIMVTPQRWVMQPVDLPTLAPVLCLVRMPGWFVFGTADGVWCLRSMISSVDQPHDADESPGATISELTDVSVYDLLGRRYEDLQYVPNGWYVAVRRTSNGVRSSIHFQQR